MTDPDTMPQSYPVCVQSPSGLRAEVNANGSIRRLDYRDIVLNLFLETEVEGGPANIYLRRHGASIEALPLLGPCSPASICVGEQGLAAQGEWKGIGFVIVLTLAEGAPAWFWHVAVENVGSTPQTIDLVYAQDVALAHYGVVRTNEYYVSQYVDFTPLVHPVRGTMLAARQNLAMNGRHPWAVIGSLGKGVSFATDALQFHGRATRAGGSAAGLALEQLPGRRHQHEHAMAVIQDERLRLEPGANVDRGFFGWVEEHHPTATSPTDLASVDQALALPEARPRRRALRTGARPAATWFTACPTLASLEVTEVDLNRLFGADRREVEREQGMTLSLFTGAGRHVVLRAKELAVLRPHGHIMRTGSRLTPDEASLTSTAWMSGVFNSQLTQGQVNINRFLSATRSYLGLLRSGGQRIFAEVADGYHLLDVPSAFEMEPNGCRWIYKHHGGLIQVRSWASINRHEVHLSVEVLSGTPCRFLISHHIAIDGDDGADARSVLWSSDDTGITIRPRADSEVGRRFPQGSFRIDRGPGTRIERIGGDELLFVDGRPRRQPFVVMVTAPTSSCSFRMTGRLVPGAESAGAVDSATPLAGADQGEAERFWKGLTGGLTLRPASHGGFAGDVTRMQEILPWWVHNAMIHYLAPRGLEQFSGGGWGTRDVSQGPVELLLSLGRWEPVRDLLLRVFQAQNADGDWPQWFMFFERERTIRASDAHGDIIFWPLLALAEYLLASEDPLLLDTVVPFFHEQDERRAERASVWEHVERALAAVASRVIPGTALAAYGQGDWNDSLQPADPSMRERLCSSWTVTLQYQMLRTLARALRGVGRLAEASRLDAMAARVREDFQRVLIAEETLAGFAYFHPGQRVEYLLHPHDQRTGIRYRLLPMIHAIITDLLTPTQAAAHVGYINEYLLGPDGARLFDQPPRYEGGPQRCFQRAESSSFFGREIGLMYMHAHLRYAEAMARYGDAEAFFLALRQANPIAVRSLVPMAAVRQANCYHSSSDAVVADRYEAQSRYDEVRKGKIAFEGGWRIYSSGAGIATRLIYQCFLGLRWHRSALIVDPVIPAPLAGLRAEVTFAETRFSLEYRIGKVGCGVEALSLNGVMLPFERQENPYRPGAAAAAMTTVRPLLKRGRNELVVQLQ